MAPIFLLAIKLTKGFVTSKRYAIVRLPVTKRNQQFSRADRYFCVYTNIDRM